MTYHIKKANDNDRTIPRLHKPTRTYTERRAEIDRDREESGANYRAKRFNPKQVDYRIEVPSRDLPCVNPVVLFALGFIIVTLLSINFGG